MSGRRYRCSPEGKRGGKMRHAPHPTNEYGGEYEHPKYEYAWKGGLKGKARHGKRKT